jgi:hypothetical protein
MMYLTAYWEDLYRSEGLNQKKKIRNLHYLIEVAKGTLVSISMVLSLEN